MPSFWDASGYQPEWGGSGGNGDAATFRPPMNNSGVAGGNAGGDMNPEGEAYDPFGYTKGSLLTPWEGHFDGSKFGGGGGGVAEYTPFQFGDFDYKPSTVANFDERYEDPGDFSYGEYTGPGEFKGVTDKDMKADKGYQFRQDQAMKVLQASKAAQGVLKTGGTLKALQKNAGDLASQEYGNVYARKKGEYDTSVDNSRFKYGTNRANAKENFDTNVDNRRQGYQLRQGTWRDNAANQQASNQLGYDVAQGTWDRNEAKARQGWQDAADHAQAVASAAASGASRDYERALDEYKMARDEFYTNQDRQYNILNNEDMKGRNAAGAYAGAQTDLALQRGNAQASGRAGAASAWNTALGNIGQSAADMGMYALSRKTGGSYSPTRGGTPYSGYRPPSDSAFG
jgi:hypothetical protein